MKPTLSTRRMMAYIGIVLFLLALGVLWRYRKQKSGAIKSVKVLVTCNEGKIKSLDPIKAADTYSCREISKVYEGLLEYHYLKKPYELIPNLAEAMPTVSEDQLVYTFQLKKGVKFHDDPCFSGGKGRELTAQDFVYSLKRFADPKLQSPTFMLLDNKIQGLNEWREKYKDTDAIDYTEDIAGVQALDRYTLRFTLTTPDPQFLHILALFPCYVVAQEAVQYYGKDFGNHPVGTGPFMLKFYEPQHSKITYYKNPTFRDKYFPSEAADEYQHMLAYAGQKLPLVDSMITHIITEEHPKWLSFNKGNIDVISIMADRISVEVKTNEALANSLKSKEVKVFEVPSVSTSFFVFNHTHPLFKNNLKLRQAMSLAFDRERYNQLFNNNTATLAQSIIPPGLPGYQADYINPYCVYDVQKAKQYLIEAGYPGGKELPTITLDAWTGTMQKQQAEFFQKCMQAIGIKVNVVCNNFPELSKKINNKATMMHAIAWSADYPDAITFLGLLYGPYQKSSEGVGVNFDDPAFNKLFEQAATIPDVSARTVLYEQLNQMAAEKLPVIYMIHPLHISLHQGWIKNYLWSDFHYGSEQYFDVDLETKQALSVHYAR